MDSLKAYTEGDQMIFVRRSVPEGPAAAPERSPLPPSLPWEAPLFATLALLEKILTSSFSHSYSFISLQLMASMCLTAF